VKQWCLSEDFIEISDKWKRLPWVFMYDKRGGKESSLTERQRERMCERQTILREGDSIGTNINRFA